MSSHNKIKSQLTYLLKKLLSVEELNSWKLDSPKKVLIVRQHNQFGDMLATIPLFRAIKEKFPDCKITLIASAENYFALKKNSLIDNLFVFDKKNFWNPFYIYSFYKVLRRNYDVAIVPVTVAISTTSCLLAGLSNAKLKIGPKSLDGNYNEMNYVFHYRINMNWKKNPDSHVSDFILDVIRPFGISTRNFTSQINYDVKDEHFVEEFIKRINKSEKILIGIHAGAGKPQNRWSVFNFTELVERIEKDFNAEVYFTGSNSDQEIIDILHKKFPTKGFFLNKTIPQLTALISKSDLFITNDTGVMHVAGATSTPVISLFGPTNPFNWAPVGENKLFIRKSEFMNDITVNDVLNVVKIFLGNKSK
ncbi:MAG: glycosyltransferase family 9 protein [Ignavibacteria bacterium]|nr:glycosyltransferase family 9 protein [Ignavibacteria bacterium]